MHVFLITALYSIAAVHVLGVFSTTGSIGKPRKPLDSDDVAAMTFYGLLAGTVLALAFLAAHPLADRIILGYAFGSLVSSVLLTMLLVGRPRKPVTGGSAAVVTVMATGTAAALVYTALHLH